MTEGDSYTPDLFAARLGLFFDDLKSELGDAASIEVEDRDGYRIVDLVRSVIAGRVIEVFGPARSRVEVTVRRNQEGRNRGRAPVGCLPIPGWMRLGRRVKYAPYR